MSDLSIKAYNSSIKKLTNYRDNLRELIKKKNYRDSLSMSQQLATIQEVREVNNKIIDLKRLFRLSIPENFQRIEGFKINNKKKLQQGMGYEEDQEGGKNRKRKITKKRKHKKRKTKKRKPKNKDKTKKR